MRSDEQLIASYRDSRQCGVLEKLVERHIGKVRAMVYQMVLDPAAADDLTQEVFLKAFRGLATFNGRASFSTWLYRLTLNTTYGFLARQKRSPVDGRAELADTVHQRQARPEHAAMQAELEAAVEQALGELSPSLRAAIVLTSVQQLDAQEAARIEGCTRATMYWRIHEARRRLKKKLQEHLMP